MRQCGSFGEILKLPAGRIFAGIFLAGLVLLLFSVVFYFNSLTFKVEKSLQGKDCTVCAAAIYDGKIWAYNNVKAPLMSVFKYFIAVSVLKKVERENLSLNDKILVKPDMVSKNTWSPMLKKYMPPFEISVEKLMKYMISESDNNAADVLIEYAGGISSLQRFLAAHNFGAVEIFANEKMMNEKIWAQYSNRAKVLDVLSAMKFFRESETVLSKNSKNFLDKIMIETVTGEDKIKAGLPPGTVFGHKTGNSSRKADGVKIADNDAGFAILPNGKTCYIAVFVIESKMSDSENAALIAQISKMVYEHIMSQGL